MAQRRRENPFLLLLIFLLLAVGLAYFLILVWEIPSPAQEKVRCDYDNSQGLNPVFLGEDVPETFVCEP